MPCCASVSETCSARPVPAPAISVAAMIKRSVFMLSSLRCESACHCVDRSYTQHITPELSKTIYWTMVSAHTRDERYRARADIRHQSSPGRPPWSLLRLRREQAFDFRRCWARAAVELCHGAL